jgi:hypothetical protein
MNSIIIVIILFIFIIFIFCLLNKNKSTGDISMYHLESKESKIIHVNNKNKKDVKTFHYHMSYPQQKGRSPVCYRVNHYDSYIYGNNEMY